MHYFALLLSPEHASPTPDDAGRRDDRLPGRSTPRPPRPSGPATRCSPSATGVRITGGPDAPTVTDGPFAESAEVAGGYYVFEADNLDDALELAREIPAAKYGGVEVWPMVHWIARECAGRQRSWLALLLEPPDDVVAPGSPRVGRGHRRARRVRQARQATTSVGGAPLHPPTTATTVRVRDGEVLLTDGPYVEGAEVANGFYCFDAADRDEAVKLASMIPATTVELRQLVGRLRPLAAE